MNEEQLTTVEYFLIICFEITLNSITSIMISLAQPVVSIEPLATYHINKLKHSTSRRTRTISGRIFPTEQDQPYIYYGSETGLLSTLSYGKI